MGHFLSDRAGKPALGIWNTLADPLAAEALASLRPDYVCIDMQHGEAGAGDLVRLVQAVNVGGSIAVVRVPSNDAAMIGRALDAGALGIVVPMVGSGQEAARAVRASRYPPAGARSYGPFRARISAGTRDPAQLDQVACIVMVETEGGLDQLDEIASTEGLAAVYVGPSDLSLALGLPPGSTHDPKFVSAVGEILAACAKHDVTPGIQCADGAGARRALEQGFKMVTVASDLTTLQAAVAKQLEEAALPAAG
jgi:4-hydroxy-2-oxoheptanedioate aldolase